MSFTQLAQPIPLYVVGKGQGMAMAVIDYGPEHNLIWVTAIDESGEIWCAPNPKVRMQANWTLQRGRSQAETVDRAPAPAASPCSCAEEDERPISFPGLGNRGARSQS